MPNRILRAAILTSEKVNELTWTGEIFFRRLMSVVDDFGRYDARPSIMRCNLFPLRLDRVSESDIIKWMNECSKAELVRFYHVDKKPYLEILQFDQVLRIKKSKYPACIASATHLHSTCMSEVETEVEVETESETRIRIEVEGKIQEIKNSSIWIEQTAMHFKIPITEIQSLLNTFLGELDLKEDLSKPIKDIKTHFINALKKNSINAKPNNNNRQAGLDGLAKLTERVLQQPFTLIDNNSGNR